MINYHDGSLSISPTESSFLTEPGSLQKPSRVVFGEIPTGTLSSWPEGMQPGSGEEVWVPQPLQPKPRCLEYISAAHLTEARGSCESGSSVFWQRVPPRIGRKEQSHGPGQNVLRKEESTVNEWSSGPSKLPPW